MFSTVICGFHIGPVDEDRVDKSSDPQVNRINLSKIGCNKHFKDSLLARGRVTDGGVFPL